MILRYWKVGTIRRCPIYVHWTWAVFPFFILARGIVLESVMEGLLQFALVIAVYGTYLVHAFGHWLVAGFFRIRFRDLSFDPLGPTERLNQISHRPWQEPWIALAGPLVHGLIVTLLALVYHTAGIRLEPSQDPAAPWSLLFLNRFFWLNVFLLILNLLPAFPLDGGKVFRGLLAMTAGRLRAAEVGALLSSFICILMLIAGMVWIQSLWWFIPLGIVLHVSGQQELMYASYFHSLQEPPAFAPASQRPQELPLEQVINPECEPCEPNFTGFTWNARQRLWIEWRNGVAVAANALVGE